MRCFTRWVCEDHPELQMVVGNLLHSYDRDEYESMANVVDAYNKAVRDTSVILLSNMVLGAKVDGPSARLRTCLKTRLEREK